MCLFDWARWDFSQETFSTLANNITMRLSLDESFFHVRNWRGGCGEQCNVNNFFSTNFLCQCLTHLRLLPRRSFFLETEAERSSAFSARPYFFNGKAIKRVRKSVITVCRNVIKVCG